MWTTCILGKHPLQQYCSIESFQFSSSTFSFSLFTLLHIFAQYFVIIVRWIADGTIASGNSMNQIKINFSIMKYLIHNNIAFMFNHNSHNRWFIFRKQIQQMNCLMVVIFLFSFRNELLLLDRDNTRIIERQTFFFPGVSLMGKKLEKTRERIYLNLQDFLREDFCDTISESIGLFSIQKCNSEFVFRIFVSFDVQCVVVFSDRKLMAIDISFIAIELKSSCTEFFALFT